MASGLVRHERSAPAVVAGTGHRLAAPFRVAFAPPDQRGTQRAMPVTIDIRPNLDTFAGNAFYRKSAAVDQRINVFDLKSAAGHGALDRLSCFVHGDAIEMEATSRFDRRKGDVRDI